MTTGERLDSIDEKLDVLVTGFEVMKSHTDRCLRVIEGNGQLGISERVTTLEAAGGWVKWVAGGLIATIATVGWFLVKQHIGE